MTDKAVSALTSLTGAGTANGDLLYIVDISEAAAADRSKKITAEELQNYLKKFPATIGVGGATPAASGAGISFPATASASSDGNTLDDYEEGEYDVVFTPSSSGSITMSSFDNRFSYTKIGRQVSVIGAASIASVSSPVGYIGISLPFAIANYAESAGRGTGSVLPLAVSSANVSDFVAVFLEGESEVRVYLGDGTDLQNDSAQQLVTSVIYVGFTYFA